MRGRATRRILTASAVLVVVGQLIVSFYVQKVGPSGIAELGRQVAGGTAALGAFVAAGVLALVALLRSRATPALRKLTGSVLAAALLAPTANAIHLFWWPSSERLVRAAGEGDLDVIERCLLFGIDPSRPGMMTHGFGGRGETPTPLAAAAASGQIPTLRRLLEAGADPATKASEALATAVNAGRPEATAILLAAGGPTEGILERALFEGPDRDGRRLAALRIVLDSGAPIEPSWLHLRAMFLTNNAFGAALARAERDAVGRVRPRVALLNAIALSSTSEHSNAASQALALYRQLRPQLAERPVDEEKRARGLAKLVRPSGASTRSDPLTGISDEALLALAAKFGATRLVEALLDDGVPVDPPDTRFDQPRSPLGYAAAAGQLEAARALIVAGADISRSDSGFGTPLHGAAGAGSLEIAELLIAHGADPDAPQNETSAAPPSHWAAYGGDVAMVKLLIARGAQPERVGHSGRTLRSIARRRGNEALLAYLDRTAE